MSDPSKETKAAARVLFFILGPFIGALFLMWYNHVLAQLPLAYWKLVLLAVPMLLMQYILKPTKYLVGLICVVCMFGQVLAWIGICKLPLSR